MTSDLHAARKEAGTLQLPAGRCWGSGVLRCVYNVTKDKYMNRCSKTQARVTHTPEIGHLSPLSLWTTLTLNIWIIHHVLLQTVEDFLNLAPGHIAATHRLRSAVAFFLWPSHIQKQLQVLAYVRERSSPIKEITKCILRTPWAGPGIRCRVTADGEVNIRELQEGTDHLSSSQVGVLHGVFHWAITGALDVQEITGGPWGASHGWMWLYLPWLCWTGLNWGRQTFSTK